MEGKKAVNDGSGANIVECIDLGKSFHRRGGRLDVLKGVSFAAKRGEVTAVTGRSGAGKSTLLFLLAGLDRPTTGRILFDGIPLESLPGRELAPLRRKRMGIIFQSFNLIPSLTALENVLAALIHAPGSAAGRADRAAAVLSRLGLGDLLGNLPGELSVGQQQRVAVARAVVNNPSVVIADEPAGDVDPETGAGIMDLLEGLVREQGVSLILATHGPFRTELPHTAFRIEGGTLSRSAPDA